MMRQGLIEIDWELAGARLAHLTDDDQVAFLRGFINECNKWGTRLEVERQLAMVNLKLTSEERETLKMLSEEERG